MKKTVKVVMAAALCTSFLLSACNNNLLEPTVTSYLSETEETEIAEVRSAEDFLDAIESGAEIVVTGSIDFSPYIEEIFADDYSDFSRHHKYIELVEEYDGVGIVIKDVRGLTISGEEGKNIELQVEPRYADVLRFEECENINISNLTMGHTPEQGTCCGDVLEFVGCDNVVLENLDLYGCGYEGITASETTDIIVNDSTIRDCGGGMLCYCGCSGAEFNNCSVYGIDGGTIIVSSESEITFNECVIEYNVVYEDGFVSAIYGNNLVFNGCTFGDMETSEIYSSDLFNAEGLYFDDNCVFSDVAVPDSTPTSVSSGFADSPEKILEALEAGVTAVIADGYYNLSEFVENTDVDTWNATHEHVFIEECADGHTVVVTGVDGLCIESASGETWNCEILVEPRHADVLRFTDCNDISIIGIEFGHTDTGECNGSVLSFENCDNVWIDNLDLFGCGVYGIEYTDSGNLHVYNTMIHDCEYGPVNVTGQRGNIYFSGCALTDSTGGFWVEPTIYSIILEDCLLGDYETTSIYFDNFVELINCELGNIVYYPENGFGGIEDYDLTELTVYDFYNCFYEDTGNDYEDWGDGAETYWTGIEYFEDGEEVYLPAMDDLGMPVDSCMLLEEHEYSLFFSLDGSRIYVTLTEASDGTHLIMNEVDPETGISGDAEYDIYFYSTDGSTLPDMCMVTDGDVEIWYAFSCI